MESDKFTSPRDTPYQYFVGYGLYEGSWDKSNCLRAITTRGGRIINLEASQPGLK
jgi:hypothetical protein